MKKKHSALKKLMSSPTIIADGGGLRLDAGKPRVDLIPGDAMLELGKVYAYGCKKYAVRNWERGMKWSDVVASLERHLLDVKLGRRLDPAGTRLRSTALLLCNAVFLCAYDIRGLDHLDDLEPYARKAVKKVAR